MQMEIIFKLYQMIQTVIGSFGKSKIELDPDSAKYINGCLVKEYINEYQGKYAW